MTQPVNPESSYTLLLIEACLTLIVIATAFAMPRVQGTGFRRIEDLLMRLARHKRLACIAVGASALLLRLALLPLFQVPHPFLPDDFSFLLAGDTFAHGRLTNPTPALWTHFESIHITVKPTYMSMYFPAPGLALAAGQALFGVPWAGLLIATSLMCAAICWMLQGWLPPGWALLGGWLSVLRIGLFSYWINTYTGGGSVSALGGALVLGALPRLMNTGRMRYAMILAAGIAILSICRPYEGLLICLPVAAALGLWALFGKNRLPAAVLMRRAAAPLALIAATLAWLGYYDLKAFGNPKILPYTVARATYAVVPYYVWQKAKPTPHYLHADMEQFYTEREARDFKRLHAPHGVPPYYFKKLVTTIFFFGAFALLPPLVMGWRVLKDRRLRFLVWCIPVWVVGMGIGIYLIPHYLAPFTAAVYALGLQCMRHMRAWRPNGAPVGRAMANGLIVLCLAAAVLRVVAVPLHMAPDKQPINPWICSWVGPGNFGSERADVAQQLAERPGQHLVFVRYAPGHDSLDEWVYNAADIDGSRTVWAQEMDAASNRDLIRHYAGRDVWLVQPDVGKGRLTPYPLAGELAAGQ